MTPTSGPGPLDPESSYRANHGHRATMPPKNGRMYVLLMLRSALGCKLNRDKKLSSFHCRVYAVMLH
ncbi:hypothetical protein ACROYT_G011622 [Oculina patagonica]